MVLLELASDQNIGTIYSYAEFQAHYNSTHNADWHDTYLVSLIITLLIQFHLLSPSQFFITVQPLIM